MNDTSYILTCRGADSDERRDNDHELARLCEIQRQLGGNPHKCSPRG